MRTLEELKENEFSMICDSLNGVVLDLKPLGWRISITENVITNNVLKSKWKVDIDDLEYKLDSLPNLEFLKLLVSVDLFWERNESYYESLNSISPKSKILEITNETQRHEPIIWDSQTGPLHEFFMVALGLNLEHVIYVQDAEGNDKSIWATSEADLLNCVFTISEIGYFGSLDTLQNSFKRGGWFYSNEKN